MIDLNEIYNDSEKLQSNSVPNSTITERKTKSSWTDILQAGRTAINKGLSPVTEALGTVGAAANSLIQLPLYGAKYMINDAASILTGKPIFKGDEQEEMKTLLPGSKQFTEAQQFYKTTSQEGIKGGAMSMANVPTRVAMNASEISADIGDIGEAKTTGDVLSGVANLALDIFGGSYDFKAAKTPSAGQLKKGTEYLTAAYSPKKNFKTPDDVADAISNVVKDYQSAPNKIDITDVDSLVKETARQRETYKQAQVNVLDQIKDADIKLDKNAINSAISDAGSRVGKTTETGPIDEFIKYNNVIKDNKAKLATETDPAKIKAIKSDITQAKSIVSPYDSALKRLDFELRNSKTPFEKKESLLRVMGETWDGNSKVENFMKGVVSKLNDNFASQVDAAAGNNIFSTAQKQSSQRINLLKDLGNEPLKEYIQKSEISVKPLLDLENIASLQKTGRSLKEKVSGMSKRGRYAQQGASLVTTGQNVTSKDMIWNKLINKLPQSIAPSVRAFEAGAVGATYGGGSEEESK